LKLLLFAPHPDDIAISMGGLVALLAQGGADGITVVLATDGSESLVTANVLEKHGWNPSMPPHQQRALRGRIRVAEAEEEAERLGFHRGIVRLLEHQRWATEHRTPREFLYDDLSLKDVAKFVPGPIDDEVTEEIRGLIGSGEETICAVPDANDRLLMHRIVTELVSRVRGNAGLLTYECLSTVAPSVPQFLFTFGEELMAVKRHAVRAHESMAERRRQFGGYSNPGTEGYDEIIERKNSELARSNGSDFPFAERYGWQR
jgi:LmbE family N-acetylglucosaminyl deacetylase